MARRETNTVRPHIVIVGGGFGGVYAAKALCGAPVDVTIIDRRNHHLFQPLLYQVATAALSPADISAPIRRLFKTCRNVSVELAEAERIDVANRLVFLTDGEPISYDSLILATGATHSYFGHDEWSEHAPGLKDTEDGLRIRNKFLLAFEQAERLEPGPERDALLTFVIVGAGPTGVELAGTMAEIARLALPRDFRNIDTREARVYLIEGQDRVLPTMPPELSARALRDLQTIGVNVELSAFVTHIDAGGVNIGDRRIDAKTVVWAAGVEASPLARTLGVELHQSSRVVVGPDLAIPDHPEIFVVGDLAHHVDSRSSIVTPAVAPAAIQMGKFVGAILKREAIAGARLSPRPQFHYFNRGFLAAIGRKRAVGVVFNRWKVKGVLAWIMWLVIHIFFLIGFRNRIMVLMQWGWMYFRFDRGARIITNDASSSPTGKGK